MYQTLLTDIQNGTLIVRVNRPDKLNAINATVMDELGTMIDLASADVSVRSVIITGEGDKAFVAGADISAFSGSAADGEAMSRKGQSVFARIEACPKPVVAAINGYALGAGCELAMSCHLRIAVERARFGQPEVNLGLIPGYGGTQRLVKLVGKSRALDMLLTGRMIDAPQALAFGLINEVVQQDSLMSRVLGIVELIHQKGPLAIRHCITAVNAAVDNADKGFAIEARLFGECFGSHDMQEGRDAFLNKRTPQFTGT